jgi:hypothetical protein
VWERTHSWLESGATSSSTSLPSSMGKVACSVAIGFAGRAPVGGNRHSSTIASSPYLVRRVGASLPLQAGWTRPSLYTHHATLALGLLICQGLAAHPYSLMERKSRYALAPWAGVGGDADLRRGVLRV